MNSVQIHQKSYEMPPREGISIAHFLTVADVEPGAPPLQMILETSYRVKTIISDNQEPKLVSNLALKACIGLEFSHYDNPWLPQFQRSPTIIVDNLP